MFLSTALSVALLMSFPDTVSVQMNFTISQLDFSTVNGYDFVSMPNTLFMMSPGYPSLPRKTLIFAIPAGSRIEAVEASVSDSTTVPGTFSIYPTQPQIPISEEDSTAFTPPDSIVYSLITPWPSTAASGSELGAMDLTELARIDVYPVSWNPGTGALVLRETIDVDIIVEADTFPAPSSVLMTNTDWARKLELLRSVVMNPDSVESYSVQPNLVDENTKGTDNFPVAVEYLIITRDAWKNSWEPLVGWNIKRGLFTEVLTVEEIQAKAGTVWALGRDWPETVRNCIRWNHVNRGVQYILFGTDTTPPVDGVFSTSEAPMRFCRLFQENTTPTPTSFTDWYYACLDPVFNWQTNSNPWWGEYYPPDSPNENDLMDLVPDIAVGRIPVHSAREARDATELLVAYQRYTISGAYPNGELLLVSAAVPFENHPENWQHLQEIASVVPVYIDRTWIAEFVCTVPDRILITPTRVLDHLQGAEEESGYYRVSFGGHGGADWIAANQLGMPGTNIIESSDLRLMTGMGGSYCTGYAYNCLTGTFVDDTGANGSIVETWLGSDNELLSAPLGPGYIGNDSQGFNSSITGGSTSHRKNQWYLDALYNSTPSSGTWGNADAINLSSLQYSAEYLEGYPYLIPPPILVGALYNEPMWDLKVSNLGGDPALPVWLKEPMTWVSDYPSTLRCPADLTISVETSGGIAIPGVRVCLMMEAATGYEIYKRGYTDSSGEYTANLDPSFAGSVHVTLTKQGYLPDEGEVRLLID